MFRGPSESSSSVLGVRPPIQLETGTTSPGDDSDLDGWVGLGVIGPRGGRVSVSPPRRWAWGTPGVSPAPPQPPPPR